MELDPNLVTIGVFVAGFIVAKWDRDRSAQTKAVQVDADVLARLKTVEQWQADHNSIHGCVRELAATVKAMANNMNRLTTRIDYWMQSMPAPPAPNRTRPYNFPGARDWILEDEQP